MKKRSDKNSATSAVAGFVGAINDRIPLPAGVELRSEAELIIWHQFTRARARSDWRDMDALAKLNHPECTYIMHAQHACRELTTDFLHFLKVF